MSDGLMNAIIARKIRKAIEKNNAIQEKQLEVLKEIKELLHKKIVTCQ
ncbi:MAG: hypothetical protein ABIH20_02695 [Candidatus Diapherotrites archaeon]